MSCRYTAYERRKSDYMKMNIFKRLCASVLAAVMTIGASQAVLADVITIDHDEFVNNNRKYRQNFTYIDISGQTNREFADETAGDGVGGWGDQGPNNDMSCFKLYGEQTFAGIKFKIINPKENNGTAAIVMRGIMDESCPTDVTIPVGNGVKGKGIYFLHSSPYGSNNGAEVGTYTIVYTDGTEEVIEIIDGLTTFNWWGTGRSSKAVSVWSGTNGSSTVNLALLPWAIDGEKEIKEIKIHTLHEKNSPYLCLTGITVTDTDPYLPLQEELDIGNPDVSDWFAFQGSIDAEARMGTAIDGSNALEKPAGKHGHVKVDGERLVFEDGTEFNLWATCIGGSGAYMTPKQAENNAKMIAAMGFNTVRFHAINPGYNAGAGIFNGNTSQTSSSTELSEQYMNMLGYLLKCLSDEGIYYGFDFSRGINFKDDDRKGISAVKEGALMNNGWHRIHWFDEEIEDQDADILRQWLEWENPYTGYTLNEDPAAIWISYCNECSLFKTEIDENSVGSYYHRSLEKQYNEWLREKYPSREALEEAWAGAPGEGEDLHRLAADEDPYGENGGTVQIFNKKDRDGSVLQRNRDQLNFMSDRELVSYQKFQDVMRKYAPKKLMQGATTCLAGQQEHIIPLYDAAVGGDFTSDQCYWYLPSGNAERMYEGTKIGGADDPVWMLYKNSKRLGILGDFAGRSVYGKPNFQTEWNASQPNPYRNEMYPMMAAMACTNDWHPVWFSWKNFPTPDVEGRMFESSNDFFRMHAGHEQSRPDAQALSPIVARMVNRQDLKKAEGGYYIKRHFPGDQYEKANQVIYTDATYSIAGKSTICFDDFAFDPDYTSNDVIKLVKDGDKTGIYASETDELAVDYNEQRYYINTPRTQGTSGWLDGDTIELDDVIFEVSSNSGHGSAYLQSLTMDDISDTDSLVFTYVADARNNGQKMNSRGNVVVDGGVGPVFCEPMHGRVTLKSKDSFKVHVLDHDGHRVGTLPVNYDEDGLAYFEISKDEKTFYYEIERTAKSTANYEPKKISFIRDGVLGDIFTDLGKYEPYKKEIERIALEDDIKKTSETTFTPDQAFTRGEAVSLLATQFKFKNTTVDPGFTDVSKDHVYYQAIANAAFMGMIEGYTNENFRPDELITKEEFLVMMYRGIQKTNMLCEKRLEKVNADLSNVSVWAQEAVTEFAKLGYCPEINDLNVKEPATRGEIAVIIYRMLWE